MDNKQAIIELKCLREDHWDDDGYGHETKEYEDTMVALDKAIKSLEAWDGLIEEFKNKWDLKDCFYKTGNKNDCNDCYGYRLCMKEFWNIINKHLKEIEK